MQASVKESNNLYASDLDEKDPLKDFRHKFFIPQKNGRDVIYFAGNSLGLQPKTAREYIEQELRDWEIMGVEGHFHAKYPWKFYHEFLTEKMAKVVGGKINEVVVMNSLTVNLNLMLVSFYRPAKERNKILIEGNAFPSDIYACRQQIKFHGYDPAESLVALKPREWESYLRTEDILEFIDREGNSFALIMFGGVNYYSGQAFDMKAIAEAGHKKGCFVGFDLAHAAGNILLDLHDWEADFAVWCSYKYLNSGPGGVAGAFVHEKYAGDFEIPRFSGWWGHKKETRFLMPEEFDPTEGIEGWQISNPPIFQMAALRASLDIFYEAGMENLREKSIKLTAYAEQSIKEKNDGRIEIITPADPEQRGSQLSLRAKSGGKELHRKLLDNNVICDWREPDVIRIAPVPLYNTFRDVEEFVRILFG